MRTALSLKSNTNSTTTNATNAKQVGNAPTRGGKLTRQTGTSNLHREVIAVKAVKEVKEDTLIKFNSAETFEVFEDPDPVEENDENKPQKKKVNEENVEEKKTETTDNNFIHDLERKMEEKRHADQKKKFMLTRDNRDVSRCSEPPSESASTVYDDDDFDKLSVASSTFTTTVRASFSTFHVNSEAVDAAEEKKKTVIKKKAEREARDEFMFSCDEYFSDIVNYMLHRQLKDRPSATYFSRQQQVNEEMRTILVDWFNDVVKEYRLQKETFHLAVLLVDRVLSSRSVDKVQFQLVGTTALMIASKYEEIFPPEIAEFAVITDNTYTVSEILSMERFILGMFGFVIALPTAAWFGASLSKRLKYTQKMSKTMNYLLDLSLTDVDFLGYRPSDVAAATIAFTNVQYEKEAWPQQMVDDTGIKTEDFEIIVKDLHRVYTAASSSDYKSIFLTYCDTEEKEVALSPAPTDKLRELFPKAFKVSPKDDSSN